MEGRLNFLMVTLIPIECTNNWHCDLGSITYNYYYYSNYYYYYYYSSFTNGKTKAQEVYKQES